MGFWSIRCRPVWKIKTGIAADQYRFFFALPKITGVNLPEGVPEPHVCILSDPHPPGSARKKPVPELCY